MGQEEQIEEREVLASIFPDEITDLSDNSYRVAITLDIPHEDNDETEPPTILLTVAYPPDYPDVPPLLDLSSPPNAPKHALFDLNASKATLHSLLPSLIDSSLGSAMVFTLVSALKDGAEALVGAHVAAQQEVLDAVRREEEAIEAAKFSGTRVTRETFRLWREGFRAEEEEEEGRRRGMEEEGRKGKVARVTGRELWERGMVGKGEEGEDEDGSAGIEALRMGG